MKRIIRLAIASSLFLVTAWMTYDNVFSDLAPIQAQAETAACTLRKCTDQHGMTKASRSVFDQSFEFSWQDGIIDVECHRAYYVVGARECTATKRP